MRGVIEASSLLDEISAPRLGRETYKAVLGRVTCFVNEIGMRLELLERPISPNRLDDIWRREARWTRSDEMDALRAARDEKLLRDARHARNSLLDKIASAQTALRVADEDMLGDQAEALGRSIGGLDRPMGQREE